MEKRIIQDDGLLNELLLSHELMHELTAIKWSLSMIFGGKFGAITDDQKDILGKLIAKNEALIALVGGLLGSSHGANQDQADIQACVEDMVDCLAEVAKKKHITVTFEKPKSALPKTSIEKGVAAMAIKNIFDNAIKYTPEGGTVSVTLRPDKERQCIEVLIRDSGIGLSKDEQGKLFNRFYRADHAAKVNPVGSGMGLFITKQIMEAHQGDIRVESEGENKGSSFYIDFPIAK
jgi:signal transduction histidine kinase